VNKRPSKSGVKRDLKENILLVDGNALFKRGFIGAYDEFNSKGERMGGLFQFITVLRKLLVEDLYHKVYVFWDGALSGKLRHDIYPEYKENRNKDYINGSIPIDANYRIQNFKVEEYLSELFIRQIKDQMVEGDDFIAYFCKNKTPNMNVTICTNDRDMSQLINDDVRIYYIDKKTFVTKENYQTHFKHHQTNAMLIKMITGDNSDCIKGIKGVKEGTLLKHFPKLTERKVELNEIIEWATEIQKERADKKQKPLTALTNIIDKVTVGSQGTKIYEINKILVDLSEPLLTESSQLIIDNLIESEFNSEIYGGIKLVYEKMKRDGFDEKIGHERFNDFLMPFKKLIEREKRLTE